MSAYNPYIKKAEQYKKSQIETATPQEILIMLYEGAIRFLVVAKKAIEAKDFEKSHKHLIKAQHIILEFMNSLDMEIGGEMAMNLYRLYEYLHYRLVQANIKKDVAMIDEVLDHLRSLKATWEEAIRIANKEGGSLNDTEAENRAWQDNLASTARKLAEELVRVSKEILIHSTNPQLPELGQLIMRRGQLLAELTALPLDLLPDASRQLTLETLLQCGKMDASIEKNLTDLQADLGDQLKHIKEARTLMDKYRAAPGNTQGFYTEEA